MNFMMNKMQLSTFVLSLAFFSTASFSMLLAQEKKENEVQLTTDTKPVILLGKDKNRRQIPIVGGLQNQLDNLKNGTSQQQESQPSDAMVSFSLNKKSNKNKKNKEAKNFYAGLHTKKFFRKYQKGRKEITETFYYLKEANNIPQHVENYFYYDVKKGKIDSDYQLPANAEERLILHGLYERKENGTTVEKGYYYLSTKDGKWENYHNSGVLTQQQNYYRGHPAESYFIYYDKSHKQLKEIVPIVNGVPHGYSISFYPSGAVETVGRYQQGDKVGRWLTYYDCKKKDQKGVRKEEWQHAKEPFESNFKPYLLRTWDEKGRVTSGK